MRGGGTPNKQAPQFVRGKKTHNNQTLRIVRTNQYYLSIYLYNSLLKNINRNANNDIVTHRTR